MDKVVNALSAIFSFLWPPPSGDKRTDRWRIAISITVMLLAAAVIMQAILIWGIAPTLFLGFATKDDAAMLHTGQTGIERKLDDVAASITADILFGQITEYYRNKCIAKRDGNTREEQLYDTLLAGALVKYQIVMKGVHYPLAPC